MATTSNFKDLIRAAFWMIGAIVSFTSMAVGGRAVSTELDTFEIMFFRSVLGIVIISTIVIATGGFNQIKTDRLPLHTIRNAAHFIGQNLWFFAIPLVDLAQLFALEFTTPIWVLLLAPLILRERLTGIGILSATLGFIGVIMVARPDVGAVNIGFLSGALCAVFFAFTAIFTRKLTLNQPILTILFYLTVTQGVFGLVTAGFDGDIKFPSQPVLPWVVMIGCAGLLAHFCLTKALSLAPASIVMPMDFARLPIIALIGAVFYAEALSLWVLVGAVVIFGANYINIMYGQQK